MIKNKKVLDMEKKYNPLNILFSVLLFGGLWGLLEATLGSFLHLPLVDAAGMFACSTTIMVPIAYFLMGACYKRTNTFRSVLYMGMLAAGIKALVCVIFHLSFNPVYYILLEATCMAGAIAVIRPTNVISFRGLGTMILANTSYLVLSMFIRMNPARTTFDAFMTGFEQYVFMFNCVAILYTFAIGSAIYGIMQLANKFSWNFDGVKKVIYSPITAGVVASAMVVVTFLIR